MDVRGGKKKASSGMGVRQRGNKTEKKKKSLSLAFPSRPSTMERRIEVGFRKAEKEGSFKRREC